MLLPSGSLLVTLMLLKYSDDLLSNNLKGLSSSKVERVYSELGYQAIKQGRDNGQLPQDSHAVTVKPTMKKKMKETKNKKKKRTKGKVGLVTRNNNGDEKFWGGTEVVMSPEEAGKIPFAEDKTPMYHFEEVNSFHKFLRHHMTAIIAISLMKILLVYPMKVAGLFLLIAASGFVGFIALIVSSGLYIFGK